MPNYTHSCHIKMGDIDIEGELELGADSPYIKWPDMVEVPLKQLRALNNLLSHITALHELAGDIVLLEVKPLL